MLTDAQRKQIHDFALTARAKLAQEAKELLEGVYGLYPDGKMDPPEKLPQVQRDAETRDLYHRLKRFLADEMQAGLPGDEAVSKLLKEVAFTHLNRLVAFKMMEARKLIRGTVDKGPESNGFKFYLADHPDDYALLQQGRGDDAYRHFLLWQCGQVAQEIKVLFDPHALPGRLFPRPRALADLLALLNAPSLADVWLADETVGWVYQYFNEPELQAAFEKVRVSKEKFATKDIASATQLFTPDWIVRYLVQNTLGRLWVQMHPDTQLVGSELLDYLIPLPGAVPPEALRPARQITLLDPACGAMHFGLVAFDLLAAMYREELARAGEAGWPETPSVNDEAEIPAAIIAHNLYGIDIDLRAVQLSALALYLKAKSLNKQARITDSNLACADVLPLNGARLGSFIKEMRFTRPVYERLIRALWARLQDVNQLGSLLRLEQELGALIEAERARYQELPLFAGMPGEFEQEAAKDEFWDIIYAQVIQGLDEFARQQAQAGADQTFFAGEATKGLRLLNVMLGEYDVVVTNPPYLSRRKMNDELADLLGKAYPAGKGDFYAAFIQRCLELAGERGYVGMLTMHSFMFISSYEELRAEVRRQAAIKTMLHCGPGLFEVGNPGTLQTTAFTLRKEPQSDQRENSVGAYLRLVHALNGDGKRQTFAQALQDGSNTYQVAQHRFDAIPGRPWAYWLSEELRSLFESLPALDDIASMRVGLQTGKNERFIRYWWEVGLPGIGFNQPGGFDAQKSEKKWFPYMKGGGYQKWFGNQDYVVNWENDGREIKNFYGANGRLASRPQNTEYYFREGITYSYLTSGNFSVRYSPAGFVFDVAGSSIFPNRSALIWQLMSILNSVWVRYGLLLINPTVNFQVGDLKKLPVSTQAISSLESVAFRATHYQMVKGTEVETQFDYVTPIGWRSVEDLLAREREISNLEDFVNKAVFDAYRISEQDQKLINTELLSISYDENEDAVLQNIEDEDHTGIKDTQEELSISWIGYGLGIILGRFQPGIPGKLGSAVYRREDFAIGSLPAPSEAEFDELVGPPQQFAYVDAEGGRHVFPAAIEQALRALAVPDGVTVLDEGHPRDLPTLVEQALRLMLGETAAQDIIRAATGDSSGSPAAALRKFLERDFFTQWHLKWYRKRPIYWPLQSARRSYGFVLFHEKVDKQILYRLQRDYLDAKRNGLRLHLDDLRGQTDGQSGAPLKQLERQIDKTAQTLAEIEEFARTIERLARAGYEPDPDWIDDGVILRLAPLWELIPIWKTEPKKHWERLAAGDFDWSHIAMRYWPERVREACRTNKSFAIAHGRESWYEL